MSELRSPSPVAEVIEPGSRTTIQDLGRPGLAHLGVPPSGAADRTAFMLANRLVGNAEAAPALETTLQGPTLRFWRGATVALSGAEVDATLDGRAVAMHSPVAIAAGEVLQIGAATRGLRTYVAIRGGLDAPLVLGSASHDQLTGLGPPPLEAGDRLATGAQALAAPAVDVAPVQGLVSPATLRVVLGPRDDWFAPDAVTSLLQGSFTVGSQVNRIGARLDGPELVLRSDEQLRSEGVIAGSIQVPPSGQPILLLADHPTTGGYAVIAVVIDEDLGVAAQLRPGDPVRFRRRATPSRPADAERLA